MRINWMRVGRIAAAAWLSHWILIIIAVLVFTAGITIYPDWITADNNTARNLLLGLWWYIKSTIVVIVLGFMVTAFIYWLFGLWKWATENR